LFSGLGPGLRTLTLWTGNWKPVSPRSPLDVGKDICPRQKSRGFSVTVDVDDIGVTS
jgi:hypothetical protein